LDVLVKTTVRSLVIHLLLGIAKTISVNVGRRQLREGRRGRRLEREG
jgi:hypothetical protein